MKLKNLLDGLDILDCRGNMETEAAGICYNSKKVMPGAVFIAVEGLQSDGHDFIPDALSRGAGTIVVSRSIEEVKQLFNVPDDAVILRVQDTRAALSRMASNLYSRPSLDMNIIGVTGTNGKTTTTYLIHSVLEQAEGKAGQIGTLGIMIDNRWHDSTHTTPESIEIHKALRQMLDSGSKSCVMEVSSHALELGRVLDVEFDAGVFTNLTHEHLDFHKTMEQYYKAKRRLFYMTGRINVINIDDPYGRRLAADLAMAGRKVLTYGLNENADIRAGSICFDHSRTEFTLFTPDGKIQIISSLPGRFNVYNLTAAAACCYASGIDPAMIKSGLERVRQIPGRYEVINAAGNVKIIIDYAHTPDGFQQLLDTVSRFSKGRIVMVFGSAGERDRSKRSVMGEIAARYSDLCILTTDDCRSEDPQDIIDQIKKGFPAGTGYVEILDREEAIRYAILNCRENDTILIAGKGHELRQIIGNQAFYLNEREVVEAALKEREQRMLMQGNINRTPCKEICEYQNDQERAAAGLGT